MDRPQYRLVNYPGAADTRIRGGLIDLRDDLPVLASDLRETESNDIVGYAVLDAVEHGVHAWQVAIIFDGITIALLNLRSPASTVSEV